MSCSFPPGWFRDTALGQERNWDEEQERLRREFFGLKASPQGELHDPLHRHPDPDPLHVDVDDEAIQADIDAIWEEAFEDGYREGRKADALGLAAAFVLGGFVVALAILWIRFG